MKKVKSGFTIIEVSLTMAVIGALLITIAIIISNVMTIYQKGLTVKAVNNVGRNLIDELTSAINSAPSVDTTSLCGSYATENVDACKNNNAFKFVYQSRNQEDRENNTLIQNAGVFCTGNYSYIWNTYYGLQNNQTISLKYYGTDGNSHEIPVTDADGKRLTLIRFEDKNYRACSYPLSKSYVSNLTSSGDNNYEIDVSRLANNTLNPIPEPQRNFLEDFDLPLLLYELTIFPISQDEVTLRSFFSGTFILATERGNVSITRSGDYCDLDNRDVTNGVVGAESSGDGAGNIFDLGSNFNYCAINKFNFAARTAGV